MKILSGDLEKEKKCTCGHVFNDHFDGGCIGLSGDGHTCMCAYNAIESKAYVFEMQVDRLIKFINKHIKQ